MQTTAVFTIVSLNYCAYAKTLMESLRATHPDWDRHVLLVDRCDDPAALGGDLFSTLSVERLPLPQLPQFLFRYGIMELNTAVKPWMFAHLRRQGYQRVVYLDPDILVIDRLADVEGLLDQGAAAVVTPHLTAPLDDGRHPSELEIMRAGSFNLGFLAIAGLPAADAFIAWWQSKLEFGAVSDPARGLFTDQKWVDLAPGMFGDFAILRDAGYNLAYWNLPHRPVTRQGEAWLAGGRPLRFFHFSGFDPVNPKRFSKHQDRLDLESIGPARELALDYARRVLAHGHLQYRGQPYAFGVFEDGAPIATAIRELYREDAEVRTRAGDNPYAQARLFIEGEAGGLPMILRGLWLQHEHLQRAFPDPLGRNRLDYYRWFTQGGGVEHGVDPVYLRPVGHLLQRAVNVRTVEDAVDRTLRQSSIWGRALVHLHRRATGGMIGPARLMQYQQVTGPVAFLRLLVAQFRASRWAGRFGLAPAAAGSDPLRGQLAPVKPAPGVGAAAPWRVATCTGFHVEPGKDAWWMGREARLVVERCDGSELRLQGRHFGEMHQLAHGRTELTISVAFDDEPPRLIKVQPGVFDVSVDMGKLPEHWPATLKLVPDASCVPAELGLSDDARRLSVQISHIAIGDRTVFSAERQGQRAAPLGVPGVNVIGYARSEHGVGQSLRQFVGALDAAGIASAVVDFNHNNLSRVGDRSLESRLVAEPQYGINVFHINADQMPEAQMQLPGHWFARYNIGYWHWELPEMLDEHLAGFHALDEVWVPSGFVQESVAKRSPIPVVRLPHAIHFSVSAAARRAQFSLPEDKFLFLMMYDFSSYQARKNPQAALAAFDLAFRDKRQAVALVIKTQNAEHHPQDLAALRERLAGRDDVVWINETLSRQQVYDLESLCDALVSLHRSEGFALGPAEAMFLGKPVIATNWSGNCEFMRPQNSLPVDYRLIVIEQDVGVYRAGQLWAEPDVEHAARLMERVVVDADFRARISREAARTMREEFSPALIGQRIRARLEYIQNQLIGN